MPLLVPLAAVGLAGRNLVVCGANKQLAQVVGGYPGYGALVSFEVRGDPHVVVGAVRLITPAVSLGSVDSLIQHPASLSHHIVPPEERDPYGVGEKLLRLSVGLEDIEDLWRDLDRALCKTQY